jgi:hypothetical protein
MPYVGQDFPPADQGEIKPLSFDLNGTLQDAETISSVVFSITLSSGTDANPSSHLSGVGAHTGTIVTQNFNWGGTAVAGNRYCISSVSTCSTGNLYSWWSYISITKPA